MTPDHKEKFSFSNKHFLAAAAGIIGFLVYANTIPNFYNLDDELITANHVLRDNSFSSFKKIFTEPYYKDEVGNEYEYRPVVLISYFFEFMIFGRNPHVSHFFNVLFYSVTCFVLFYLLLSLFRTYDHDPGIDQEAGKKHGDWKWMRGLSGGYVLAIMTTLLFAVHPLHTEVVASIKNRDELLSLLFGLLSWYCALRFIDYKKISFFLLYVIFFATGLFSKQTIITFSLLIPASIILCRQITLQRLLALILPVVLITTIFSPVYLIFKKILLFFLQIALLTLFYYFISNRQTLLNFTRGIFHKTRALLAAIAIAIKNYFRAFSFSIHDGFFHFKAKFKVLAGTLVALAFLAGAVTFVTKKKETVEQARWRMKDAIHDFNELQVVPAMKTAAPTVVPTAGRKLNYAELPLLYEDDFIVKLSTSITVMGKYLKIMVVPFRLKYYYGFGEVNPSRFDKWHVWLTLAVHLALLSGMLYLLFQRKHLIAAFGLMFYLVSLVPLSNLITPIAGVMAERLAYAPSLGFCIMSCYALYYWFNKWKNSKPASAKAIAFFYGILIILFAGTSMVRNSYWKDHLTLMQHDIKYLGNSARANHLLASLLAVKATEKRQPELPENKKMLEESLAYFKKTLDIYPDFPNVWYEIAKVHLLLGDRKSAIDAYYNAAASSPAYAPASFELGIALEQTGRSREAEEAYKQAIQRDSLFKEAYINLSYLYYKQARYEESVAVHKAALSRLPNIYELYLNLGRTYLMLNDVNNALSNLEKAVAINNKDKDLLNMMSQLFETSGNSGKAKYYKDLAK